MRITFIIPTPNMSGGIRVVAIYASLLKARGHEVSVISRAPARISPAQKLKSVLRGRGWPKQPAVVSHLDGLSVDHRVLEAGSTFPDADIPDADVVIATWWETAEWVARLAPSKGAKAYFIQHHEVFRYLPVQRVKATYRLPLHKIVIASWLQEVMFEAYGDACVDVVPNSVDHGQFNAPRRGRQARPTVGFLHHDTHFKGMDVALATLVRLRERFPDMRAMCFGSRLPSGNMPLPGWVEFIHDPAQDVIKDIYASCDLWLSTSRSEGFNLPAMEAMACRTPVVSTRTGWPAEAIEAGWNGMLAEVDDVAGLVHGAEEILALPEPAWQVMSDRAWQTVASSSWENSTRLFEQALRHACTRAERGEVMGPCTCPA
jgi:glycosyltransferase involved in cell wall biosynthesis